MFPLLTSSGRWLAVGQDLAEQFPLQFMSTKPKSVFTNLCSDGACERFQLSPTRPRGRQTPTHQFECAWTIQIEMSWCDVCLDLVNWLTSLWW